MKTKIIILSLLSIFKISFAQKSNWQPIFSADYTYSDKPILKGGLEFILTNDTKKDTKLFLGTGYGMVTQNGNIHGLTDIHLSYNVGSLLFAKVGSSNYHTYYMIGISGFNLFDLGIGYSLPYKNATVKIQGFTAGITFRITNRKDVYGKLKIGF